MRPENYRQNKKIRWKPKILIKYSWLFNLVDVLFRHYRLIINTTSDTMFRVLRNVNRYYTPTIVRTWIKFAVGLQFWAFHVFISTTICPSKDSLQSRHNTRVYILCNLGNRQFLEDLPEFIIGIQFCMSSHKGLSF